MKEAEDEGDEGEEDVEEEDEEGNNANDDDRKTSSDDVYGTHEDADDAALPVVLAEHGREEIFHPDAKAEATSVTIDGARRGSCCI